MSLFIKLTLSYVPHYEAKNPPPDQYIWVNANQITSMQPLIQHQLSLTVQETWEAAKKLNHYAQRPDADNHIPYTSICFAAATAEDVLGPNVSETPEQILELIRKVT